MTHTLAYYDIELIKTVESFIVQAQSDTKLKTTIYFETGEVFKTFQKIIFKQNNLLRFSYYIFWVV